jgi:DNA-directed RNA polymerase specialized sigma24 family protein
MSRFAGHTDADLAAGLRSTDPVTVNEVLKEIVMRHGDEVERRLLGGFRSKLDDDEREQVYWDGLQDFINPDSPYDSAKSTLLAWWWLHTKNRAIDLLRRRQAAKRGNGKVLSLDALLSEGDAQALAGVLARDCDGLNLRDLRSLIEDCLTKMPQLHQDIIRTRIRLYDGLEPDDGQVDQRIADRQHVSVPTVVVERVHARWTLNQALAKRWHEVHGPTSPRA